MKISINTNDNLSLVTLEGEIDGQSAPMMEEQILPLVCPHCKILLDMGGISYVSSIGLRALLLLHRETTAHEGHIVICCLSEMIYDTMHITGFLDFFEAYDTQDEALAALRAY